MPARREVVAPARRIRRLAGLALASLLGCVHQQPPPAPLAPPAAAPVPPGRTSGTPPSPSTAPPPAQAPAASASPAPGAPNTPPAALNPPARPTAAAAPAPKRSAPAPGPAATASGGTAVAARAPSTVPAPAAAPGPPPLDLASLEQRLRDTRAIGVFTKLSLKNQVDDLLAEFRAFYGGRAGLTLAELRRSYELLLMKVVTLLQNDDPGLAGSVSSSREAIWAILSDRDRFNNL